MNALSSDIEVHARLHEVANEFKLSERMLRFEKASGGVNNCTAFALDDESGQKLFVIRIYIHTTPEAIERVIWEGRVLQSLAQEMAQTSVSFQVPRPILHPETRETYATLKDGSLVSVFQVIPGALCSSDPALARNLGRAAGELSVFMSRVKVTGCPLPPVHDVYAAHTLMSKESFASAINKKELDGVRETMDYLVKELLALEIEVQALKDARSLPTQLIHADLHHENALSTEDGKISGILDFEFAAIDWRAQDLAICLSKYVSEPEPLLPLAEFCAGWLEACPLNEAEAESLPTLIRLRILSNVVFFIGRWLANEASIETLIGGRAQAYVKRLDWIKVHQGEIRDLVRGR